MTSWITSQGPSSKYCPGPPNLLIRLWLESNTHGERLWFYCADMGVNFWAGKWSSARGQPLEIGSKNQNFLESLNLAAKFRLIQSILVSVYLSIWHCSRARFTVLVSCNDIAVRSCQLLCLQSQVLKLASGLFHWWSSLRNNSTAINVETFASSCDSRRISACDQGSHCGVCFFSRPACLGSNMKNRVKSVFFKW